MRNSVYDPVVAPLAIEPAVIAALVAAGVSIATTLATKLWLDRRAHKDVLEIEYEYEQRKALRALIGRYHGRLLDSAISWHYRMTNIYANWEEGWLDATGHYGGPAYDKPAYYFRSTVYRFLALEAHSHLFTREQIFIDARVAQPSDLDFVKLVNALHWVMTDAALFEGLAYEVFEGPDHITSDRLRALTDTFLSDGSVPSFRAFEARLDSEAKQLEPNSGADRWLQLERIFKFFDGVSPKEERLRWDRLVCLHLLTIAFVRQFGYEWTRPSEADVANAVGRIEHARIAGNFVSWMPVLGLANHEGLTDVTELLRRRAAES